LGYIGQDSFQAGVIAGKLFETSIKSKSKKIIILNLGPTATNALHLLNKEKGLKQYFSGQNDTTIVNHEIVDFKNKDLMREEIQNILLTHTDINGILVTNSRSKYAAEILADLDLPKKICFIGFDLLPKNVDYLNKGIIDFLLNQNPEKQTELAIKRIADFLIFFREEPFTQYLPLDIIIKENVSYYLSQEIEPSQVHF
jgi:LacI family transcriptional regulator